MSRAAIAWRRRCACTASCRRAGSPARIARAARSRPPAARRRRALPARILRRPAPAHRHRPRARGRARDASSPTSWSRRSTSRCRRRSSTCCWSCRTRLGLTLLFVAHDLRLVRHISHRVAVMYLGRVRRDRPDRGALRRPAPPLYAGAAGSRAAASRPAPRRGRKPCAGELPSPLAPPPGCPFHPRCPLAEPVCRERVPALDPRGGSWPVACHLAGEPSG